jgi:aminopeptidase-like protein
LVESLSIYLEVVRVLENNRRYQNLNPKCEVRLGKRGLYRTIGGEIGQPLNELALLWVLNLSDGSNSLLDISERSGLPFYDVESAAGALLGKGLLKSV